MKLFQIEEPEGGPADAEAPGAAVGIDASGALVEVATAVGGNAAVLADREGFERSLAALPAAAEWLGLMEGVRLRAERALLRPVTHAVIVLAAPPDPAAAQRIAAAAEEAGLVILRLVAVAELPPGSAPVLAAAILAEELAPRPQADFG